MSEPSGMRDLARLIEPDKHVMSTSNPEPELRSLNVVGFYRSQDAARNAVLALENIEDDDAAVGLTVLGSGLDLADNSAAPHTEDVTDSQEATGADPEGVMGEIAPRALKGGAIGAVLGAIVVGGGAALVGGGIAAAGGIAGGVLFGGAIGGVWGAFARMGGSDAYRQTFVDEADVDVIMVSLHTDDEDKAEQARSSFALASEGEPVVIRFDEHGLRRI